MAQEKEYTGTITLGAVTPTYDLESAPQNFISAAGITKADLDSAAKYFVGDIMQVPPIHSAIKQKGKPVYLLARKGKDVQLEPRKIVIRLFEITSFQHNEEQCLASFRVVCSTGTYIRSLAHDFGQHLGCGAYLSSLRRTRIGSYKVEDAKTMESTLEFIHDHFKKDN